jgi:hypothetical protein
VLLIVPAFVGFSDVWIMGWTFVSTIALSLMFLAGYGSIVSPTNLAGFLGYMMQSLQQCDHRHFHKAGRGG